MLTSQEMPAIKTSAKDELEGSYPDDIWVRVSNDRVEVTTNDRSETGIKMWRDSVNPHAVRLDVRTRLPDNTRHEFFVEHPIAGETGLGALALRHFGELHDQGLPRIDALNFQWREPWEGEPEYVSYNFALFERERARLLLEEDLTSEEAERRAALASWTFRAIAAPHGLTEPHNVLRSELVSSHYLSVTGSFWVPGTYFDVRQRQNQSAGNRVSTPLPRTADPDLALYI